MPSILAGDVGGTKVILARMDAELRTLVERRYTSRDHASLEDVITDFLGESEGAFDAACIGIAGPVRDGRCRTTNLPWEVDSRGVAARLSLPPGRVSLVNDLVANAHGLGALPASGVKVLREGRPDEGGNQALIAAGTGLGEAGLVRQRGALVPFATEGGHAGFAPRSELEVELLQHLAKRSRPVTWEHVLSGPGLVNVHEFLRDTGRTEEPAWLAEEKAAGDAAAAISGAALTGRDEGCVRALDMFCSLYGSEARNLALKCLATGGVWLGGGIAPRILAFLEHGGFNEAFLDAGAMSALVGDIPVRVVLDERTALLGAARIALSGA